MEGDYMTKQEALQLCEKTWEEFQNIKQFYGFPQVNIQWDLDRDSKRAFGSCRWNRYSIHRVVSIFKTHYETSQVDAVVNTIVHELCHAIDYKFSKHGAHWKWIAQVAGQHFKTKINRCDNWTSEENQERRKKAIASLICNTCGHEYLLFKRSGAYLNKGKGYSCGKCGKGHDLSFQSLTNNSLKVLLF
jgi:predicted SprT family Zn-dependent metalloprotease